MGDDVTVRYTLEADELALYALHFNKTTMNSSKVEVDVHRRLVGNVLPGGLGKVWSETETYVGKVWERYICRESSD